MMLIVKHTQLQISVLAVSALAKEKMRYCLTFVKPLRFLVTHPHDRPILVYSFTLLPQNFITSLSLGIVIRKKEGMGPMSLAEACPLNLAAATQLSGSRPAAPRASGFVNQTVRPGHCHLLSRLGLAQVIVNNYHFPIDMWPRCLTPSQATDDGNYDFLLSQRSFLQCNLIRHVHETLPFTNPEIHLFKGTHTATRNWL